MGHYQHFEVYRGRVLRRVVSEILHPYISPLHILKFKGPELPMLGKVTKELLACLILIDWETVQCLVRLLRSYITSFEITHLIAGYFPL